MSEKKHAKSSRGRHVADDANTTTRTSDDGSCPAAQPPSATAALPQAAKSQAVKPVQVKPGQPPRRYAGEQAFPPGSTMLPVDAAESAKRPRRHRPLKIIGITLGVLLGLVLLAYAGVAVYFNGRFMPNTSVGDLDVSLMTSDDAQKVLAGALDDYTLSLSGEGFSLELTAADAGLAFDEAALVQSMLDDVNPWMWPVELRKEHDESDKLIASNTGAKLDEAVRGAVEAFNESAEQPVNATIAYVEEKGAFAVQPEAVGTALDPDAVVMVADEAASALDPTAKLTAEQLLQPTVRATDAKLIAAADKANAMIAADLVLTMAGDTAAEINANLISQWVVLDESLDVTLDEGALTAWVEQLSKDCNTAGTERTYTRPDGKVITVSGGPYGWAVDGDALLKLVKDGVAAGTNDTVEVPCSSTGTAYNGPGAQDWSSRYVDIDLAEQHVRFYDGGELVWESDCVSGSPDGVHDTSVGVFWLNAKQSPSKLIGYENGKKIYETKVQYWMPFDGNAIGMHDADWQPYFGGNRFREVGGGSHGCVNLPPSKAQQLYGLIQEGDVVVSHW